MLSCSTKHVDHLVKQGSLSAVRLGPNTVRITRQSLEKFIAQ